MCHSERSPKGERRIPDPRRTKSPYGSERRIFRRFFNHPTKVSLIFAFSYFVLTYGIPMMLMDM